MEAVTVIYLVLMFIAMYMFFFFIVLILRNKNKIFYYPKSRKKYSVSVLIPAYNEEDTIKETVEAVSDSEYPVEEIIVINDGSKDKTSSVVQNMIGKYKNLKLLDKQNSGKADSLNKAIEIAKGELIAVTDADSFPEKDAIGKMVGFFNDKKVGAVTSAVFVRNNQKFIEKLQTLEYIVLAFTRKLFDFVDSVYVTNGPLSIYRADILKKIGGFDVNSITEDIEVTWHILSKGYKTKMCLSAFVTTKVPLKFSKWFRQRERWGIGGIDVIFKYRKDFLRKGMFGFFVIPFVSISILLSIAVFIFGLYIVGKSLFSTFLSTSYSVVSNAPLVTMQTINLHPSILIFFTLVLFVTSFFYSRYILLTLGTKKKEWKEIGKLFNRFFYLLVYLTLYPVVWFSAIYRMIRKDYRW